MYKNIFDNRINKFYKINSIKGMKLLEKYKSYSNYHINNNIICPGNLIVDLNNNWVQDLYNFFINLYNIYLIKGLKKDTKQNLNCCPFIFFSTELLKNNKIKFNFSIFLKNYYNLNISWKDLKTENTFKLSKNIIIKTNSRYQNSNKTTIKESSGLDCSGNYKIEYLPYYNVFVNNVGCNLSEYIYNLGTNKIIYEDFEILFRYLVDRMNLTGNYTLNNHNMDVPILHFKFTKRININ